MLQEASWCFSTPLGEYKLFAQHGVLIATESKTYEEIIALKPSASRPVTNVIFAEVEDNQLYLVCAEMVLLYNLRFHQVDCIYELPAKALSAYRDNQSIWVLFEAPLLIKFGVCCDQKTKNINMTHQFVLPMAATGLCMLEQGIFVFYDNDGKLWFNQIEEYQQTQAIDESMTDTTQSCDILKIKQMDLNAVDSVKEDTLFVNVLQHSEK